MLDVTCTKSIWGVSLKGSSGKEIAHCRHHSRRTLLFISGQIKTFKCHCCLGETFNTNGESFESKVCKNCLFTFLASAVAISMERNTRGGGKALHYLILVVKDEMHPLSVPVELCKSKSLGQKRMMRRLCPSSLYFLVRGSKRCIYACVAAEDGEMDALLGKG